MRIKEMLLVIRPDVHCSFLVGNSSMDLLLDEAPFSWKIAEQLKIRSREALPLM